MSLYADALHAANTSLVGSDCSLSTLVREHPEGDDIARIVRDHRIKASVADRLLNGAGISLAAQTIRRHRLGECKHCAAIGDVWLHKVDA